MASPFRVENGVVTYNGRPVSELSEEEKTQGFGSLGNIQFGWGIEYDPRFYDVTYSATDDSGNSVANYQLKPEFRRWENLIQVGIPRSVGGYSEVNDPSQIFWDDELGYVTNISNFRGPKDSGIGQWIVPMLALGMGAAIAATGGFAGLFGAAAGEGAAAAGAAGSGAAGGGVGAGGGILGSGFPAGAGIAGPALETAGIASGAGTAAGAGAAAGVSTAGLGAAPAAIPTAGIGGGSIFPAGAGIGAGGPLLETAALGTTVPATTQALANASTFMSNLSPLSQRIITSAIGQGVSAISASRRQEDAQRFAREQSDIAYQRRREEEERAAEERRIRGTPQAYTFTITPRSRTGIIGSGMGGG